MTDPILLLDLPSRTNSFTRVFTSLRSRIEHRAASILQRWWIQHVLKRVVERMLVHESRAALNHYSHWYRVDTPGCLTGGPLNYDDRGSSDDELQRYDYDAWIAQDRERTRVKRFDDHCLSIDRKPRLYSMRQWFTTMLMNLPNADLPVARELELAAHDRRLAAQDRALAARDRELAELAARPVRLTLVASPTITMVTRSSAGEDISLHSIVTPETPTQTDSTSSPSLSMPSPSLSPPTMALPAAVPTMVTPPTTTQSSRPMIDDFSFPPGLTEFSFPPGLRLNPTLDRYPSLLMQAVHATQVVLDVELSTPMGPRQTQRTKDHMIAVLTKSRDEAVCTVLNSMTPVTRLCLAFPSCLRARIRAIRRSRELAIESIRATLRDTCRRRCIVGVLAHPLCTRYLLVLRARAASRLIARDRTLAALAAPPPRLDRSLDFDSLGNKTPWIVLHDDDNFRKTLYHRYTGAIRVAPWIALRTPRGRVYFANLVTRVTRWLPPPCWHDGWLSCTNPFDPRLHSHYRRMMLPQSLASVQIEGGARFVDPLEEARRLISLRLPSIPLYLHRPLFPGDPVP